MSGGRCPPDPLAPSLADLHRLGCDRRAWKAQTLLALAVLPVTYLVSPQDDNINWVFGPGDVQQWMPPVAGLGLLMVGIPFAVYWPTDGLLTWWSGRRGTQFAAE